MLHSLLHKCELSLTPHWKAAINDSVQSQAVSMSYLSCASSLTEPDHHEGCSRKAHWLELWQSQCYLCSVNRDCSHSPFEAPSWLWSYGLSQLKSVPSIGYLQNTRELISKEFGEKDTVRSKYSTWQRILSRRHGFNLQCTFLNMRNSFTITMYWENSQATIRCDKLNYDVVDIHCTAPSKMKLIYL